MGRYLHAIIGIGQRIVATLCLIAISAPVSAEDLVIVSPHWEGVRYEFAEAFNAQRGIEKKSSVDFKWLDVGGTSEIVRFMRSQFQKTPQGIGVDLLFGGGVDPFLGLKQSNLLTRLSLTENDLSGAAQTVAGIPLHDPDGYFYAPTMSAFGILCNKVVLDQLHIDQPKTWDDLGNPQLRGWIGAADPRGSGSVHMSMEIILQAYGWDRGWQALKNIGANVRSFVTNSAQVSKDVSNGEIACGLAIDTQAWPLIQSFGSERISFVIPEGLSVVNGDSIAILKGAPHTDLAREFITFLFSKPAQRLWLQKKGSVGGPQRYDLSRFAVVPEIYNEHAPTIVGINPFDLRSSIAYNFQLGASRWKLVNELIGIFIIDARDTPNSLQAQRAPITEAEEKQLIETEDSLSPIQHAELLHRWELTNNTASISEIVWKGVPAIMIVVFALGFSGIRYLQREKN